MIKTEQLDKLEELSRTIGIRSVMMCAYTEGFADALRESFLRVAKPDQDTVNFINDAPAKVENIIRNAHAYLERPALADMEHAGVSDVADQWEGVQVHLE